MKTRAGILLAVALAVGCGRPAQPPPAAPKAQSVPASVTVQVSFEDLEGKPVIGVTPIAVREPNAFEAPVATGTESGTDGKAAITLPTDQRLYVRGWVSNERWFTNSFSETTPGQLPQPIRIMMAPGAAADIALVLPDGTPAANRDVEMMMLHPTRGPWWPARGATRPDGVLHFRSLPPGQFILQLTTLDGYKARLENAVLQPASQNNLGTLTLTPSEHRP